MKLDMITFMYVFNSGILLSAISCLLPMKTFPKGEHVDNEKGAGTKSPGVRCIIKAHIISHTCCNLVFMGEEHAECAHLTHNTSDQAQMFSRVSTVC